MMEDLKAQAERFGTDTDGEWLPMLIYQIDHLMLK